MKHSKVNSKEITNFINIFVIFCQNTKHVDARNTHAYAMHAIIISQLRHTMKRVLILIFF